MPVVTFYQLPAEACEFAGYLQTTGDVYARAVLDDFTPLLEPAPFAEFWDMHAGRLCRNGVVNVFVGLRDDVLNPVAYHCDDGRVTVDSNASRLIHYTQGQYCDEATLAQSNLHVATSFVHDREFCKHPPNFIAWGKRVLAWMRRRASQRVPVLGANYWLRATLQAKQAHAAGMKMRNG
jgi:hypothetical protein